MMSMPVKSENSLLICRGCRRSATAGAGITITIAFPFLIACSCPAFAAEGGLSNYVPAFYGDLALAVEPPDGFSFRNDLFYYNGDATRSLRSGEIRIDADVTLLYEYASFVYKPPGFELFGAPVAFGVTGVLGNVDIEAGLDIGGQVARVDDDATGIGDLTLAAVLYWNRGKVHWSWSNYLVTPVGEYDVDDLANPGVNYWTFETDFAATYLDEETGRDYSVVVGYGYNSENDDTNYQSGDEVHVDFVLNQFFTESFAVGINGYFYKQVGGDSGNGAILGGFRGEGAGIGPAVYYIRKIGGRDVAFVAKWMHDVHAENRIEGDYAYASFMFSF